MQRFARLLVVAVLMLVPVVGAQSASAQIIPGEHVQSYDVTMTLERDGTLHIVEEITYNFGVVPRHGIFRDLVQREHFDKDHDRRYRINVESVVDGGGVPVQYKRSTNGPYLHLKMGDPNTTVTGVKRYVLTYTVVGAPKAFPDHDELYWDAIGNQWTVPIANAKVVVTGPARFTNAACFAGPQGSFAPCESVDFNGRVGHAEFTHNYLADGSGLTIVVGMPKGTIQPPPQPILEHRRTFANAFSITKLTAGLSGGLALLGILLVVLLASRRGRDRRYTGSEVDAAMGNVSGEEEMVPILHREDGPVEFIPPDDIRPGQVGTLIDEEANLLDVTASIVDLAVRGFLTITELDPGKHHRHPDYELTATPGNAKGTPLPYEQLLLHEIFDNRNSVKLSDLKYKFRGSLEKIQNAMYEDSVAQGWYRIRPDKTRERWLGLSLLVIAIGVAATVAVAYNTSMGLIPLAVIVAGFALFFAAGRMPARTGKGTATLSRVRGFRRLFDEGEEDVRAHFAEEHDIFSRYLPYAIVFGCTKKWARTFEGIGADQANPGWYIGNHPFNALILANAVDDFGTTATGTMYASVPSSSGSSGFSGGFSGGGGGGGGGGSW